MLVTLTLVSTHISLFRTDGVRTSQQCVCFYTAVYYVYETASPWRNRGQSQGQPSSPLVDTAWPLVPLPRRFTAARVPYPTPKALGVPTTCEDAPENGLANASAPVVCHRRRAALVPRDLNDLVDPAFRFHVKFQRSRFQAVEDRQHLRAVRGRAAGERLEPARRWPPRGWTGARATSPTGR